MTGGNSPDAPIRAMSVDDAVAAFSDCCTKSTILIVDDDSVFRTILHEALTADGYDVIEASDGPQAIVVAHRDAPDLILIDAIMPGMDGFEVCRHIKNTMDIGHVPIVMVTALEDLKSVNRAVAAGAISFVTKPVNFAVLVQQVRFILHTSDVEAEFRNKQAQLEAAQRDAEDQIRKLAHFDKLTGLASRSSLKQHLDDSIQNAARQNESFALLFLDLDGFKDINDSLGHDVGDRLLTIVASRLTAVLRDGDFVARLGGDEFCMIVKNLPDQYKMAEVAQRCLEAVGRPVELVSHQMQPRISVGIAHYPHDGENAHSLIKAADSAMYAAKRAGKNCYAFYSPEMTEQAGTRLEMDNDLRTAFRRKEFVLHYQPQISLATGNVVGVEALIRWQHPTHGLMSPSEFVPATERIGLVRDLGNYVIETACAQLREWKLAQASPGRVSINVSAIHLRDATIVDTIRLALRENCLQPADLELEITESAMQCEIESRRVLKQLAELGIRIAIDDFGTGYSSLSSLKLLPINRLKIDRIFIRDMLRDTQDAILLGAIIGLAHALGYTVVAEGVEELAQLQVLSGIDCDMVQGFYFSKPVPASEIPGLVHRNFLPVKDGDSHANDLTTSGIG